MVKNIVIFCAFLIAGIAMYRCHQLSTQLANARYVKDQAIPFELSTGNPTPTPSSTHEMYQLWIDGDFYVLKDGDRQVWKGKAGDNSQIDQIVIQDNL